MGIAGMGSATIFFWLQLPNVRKNYRTALTITGLVTFIATYHYIRIFNSWVDAFTVSNSQGGGDYKVALSGNAFNDAYRYVDWLLTVPLLLIELILVMKLPVDQTVSMSWNLGGLLPCCHSFMSCTHCSQGWTRPRTSSRSQRRVSLSRRGT